MPNNNEFIGPKKEEEEKKEEAKSGYLYDQSTNTFKNVGSASGTAGYVSNKQYTSVPRTASANEINSSNKGQAVIATRDSDVVVNRDALKSTDKLYIGSGNSVVKKGEKGKVPTFFGNGEYLETNLYTLEREDTGRKDGYTKNLTKEELLAEQKKLREYNKEKEEEVFYCDENNDTVSEMQGPIWRKKDGDNGLIYNILDVLNNPGGISFEGYLLYEQPIDIDKYVKSVDDLGNEIGTPIEKVKVNTEAFVANTTTDNENSAFDDQTRAERNKLNQAINNVEETGKIKDRLIKDLSSKQKEFDDFNKNLRYLKRGVKLKMLIEEKNAINKEHKLLRETSNIESYPYYSFNLMHRESKQISDTEKVEYEVQRYNTKRFEPAPGTNGVIRYEYQLKVIARTYLYIKDDDGIPKEVAWENRESFLGHIKKLEERFEKAGRGYRIPYKGKNIVDMDDPGSRWYYDK